MTPEVPPAAAPAGGGQVVPSVLRAVRILDSFADGPPTANLTSLSRRLGLPPSSALALCNSLVQAGLLQRDPDGAYRLGSHALELSRSFLRQTDLHSEFQRALTEADALRPVTVVCAVLQGRDVVYIGRRDGTQPVAVTYEVGLRLPAHCAASGLAMLSELSDAELAERYPPADRAGLPTLTPRSISTVEELYARLAQVRRRGYAVDDEETALGMLCVGVAIRSAGSTPAGAVAVSLPKASARKRELPVLAADVGRLAARISGALGAPPA
jgi:IclR family transcriptional regulator, blcABC operon repressor